MLTKNFGHRVPEIRSHDATEIRPRYVLPQRRTNPEWVSAHLASTMTLRRDAFPALPVNARLSRALRLRIAFAMLSLSHRWKKNNTIIVLGAGTSNPAGSDETKPSLISFSRITTAATLYHNCKINSPYCHILISGGDPQHHGKTEAATYREILINLGIKDTDIQLEPNSKNTFENAKFISALLEQQPSNQTLLVSLGLTLRRALLYFSYFNIYPTPVPADFITIPFSKFPLAYNLAINDFAVHEIIGIAQFYIYNFFGWSENKPIINKNS